MIPLPFGPWSDQIPEIADPDRRAYAEQITDYAPAWAVTALGPVPDHPVDRLDCQQRSSSIGAWRELSGYDNPAEPVGPEPAAATPDLRAVWHEAFAALGPVGGPDVRGTPDGRLLHLRDTYPIETAWAPQWVGDELRQVRASAWNARLAGAEAAAGSVPGVIHAHARARWTGRTLRIEIEGWVDPDLPVRDAGLKAEMVRVRVLFR